MLFLSILYVTDNKEVDDAERDSHCPACNKLYGHIGWIIGEEFFHKKEADGTSTYLCLRVGVRRG